jgi:hypothetical protein
MTTLSKDEGAVEPPDDLDGAKLYSALGQVKTLSDIPQTNASLFKRPLGHILLPASAGVITS